MSGLIASIGAMFGVSSRFQRLTGWLILIAGVAMAVLFVWLLASMWLDGQRDDAVQDHSRTIEAAVANAALAADREAATDKHIDELVANRAAAEQSEAINASLHDPGGDPLDAAFDRMR